MRGRARRGAATRAGWLALGVALGICASAPALAQSAGQRAILEYKEAKRVLDEGGDADTAARHLYEARRLLGETNLKLQYLLVKALFEAKRHEEVVREADVFFELAPDPQLVIFDEIGRYQRESERIVDERRRKREAEAARRRAFEEKWGAGSQGRQAEAAYQRALSALSRGDAEGALSGARRARDLMGRDNAEVVLVVMEAYGRLRRDDDVVATHERLLRVDGEITPRQRERAASLLDGATSRIRARKERERRELAQRIAHIRGARERLSQAESTALGLRGEQCTSTLIASTCFATAMASGVVALAAGIYGFSELFSDTGSEDNTMGTLVSLGAAAGGGFLAYWAFDESGKHIREADRKGSEAERWEGVARRERELIEANPEVFEAAY